MRRYIIALAALAAVLITGVEFFATHAHAQKIPIESRYATVNGVRLHYLAAGKGAPSRPDCGNERAMKIVGDTPGAISFDVYRQLHPVTAQHLALFVDSGQVKLLRDGLPVCTVRDDGVDDPSAVLVRAPSDKMSFWVNASNLAGAR